MLHTLLESRAVGSRRTGGTLVSIGVHTAAIALAVVATARATATPRAARLLPSKVIYVAPPPPNERRREALVTGRTGTTIIPRCQCLIPGFSVPPHLPPIDLPRP